MPFYHNPITVIAIAITLIACTGMVSDAVKPHSYTSIQRSVGEGSR